MVKTNMVVVGRIRTLHILIRDKRLVHVSRYRPQRIPVYVMKYAAEALTLSEALVRPKCLRGLGVVGP